MTLSTQLDHLVVAARSLDEGVAWCEATLGVTPGAGGEHKLFGTHNRLFRIATVNFPRAYFEIMAINPHASSEGRAASKRWFDMDDEALQKIVAQGPRLVHFVVNTSDAGRALAELQKQNIDRGPALQASRMTANGLLEWQITVRGDGQRLFNGALPTLIQWGRADNAPSVAHPANGMPDSGVSLHSLRITHPKAKELHSAYQAIGLQGITVDEGAANLIATLHTPKGLVTLESKGI